MTLALDAPVASPQQHVEITENALETERSGRSAWLTVRAWTEPVAALVLLLILLPVLAVTALAVRLTSPGPAVFRQTRVGHAGREFTIYKFRTMRNDAERELEAIVHLNEHDGLLFKIRRDPRLTSIGKFLRRSSIDELPQLWNVVRGDMSLIGPRPALPREVAQYDSITARRLAVKPGITGLWQVNGRSELSGAESIRYDLDYVDRWTPALDVKILARTFRAVVSGRGAW